MKTVDLLKRFRFIILSVAIFVMIAAAVVTTILNIYKPMYKASVKGEFVGYFESAQQFDEVFNTLLIEHEQESQDVKVYLDENPVFEKSYIRQDIIDNQNVYTNVRAQLRTEYTIYRVKVNNEEKMMFDSEEDAKSYAEGLKKEVEKLNVVIEQDKTSEKDSLTTSDRANAIYKDIVSRYKPTEVVKAPVVAKKTTNKNSTNGIAGSTYESGNLSEMLSGGIWPTTSRRISCHFGGYAGHTGTDIDGRTGDPNYAYKAGKVIFAGWSGGYGNLVKVDHGNGFVTYYAHNSKLLVSVGDYVNMGQTIAIQGNTGNSSGDHLHFEIRVNGRAINAYPYIRGK